MNNNSTNKIDYDALILQRSLSFYYNIKTLKLCLDLKEQERQDAIKILRERRQQPDKYEIGNKDIVTTVDNLLNEKYDKLRYSVLDDLENIFNYISNTDYIPEYDLKLLKSPRYKKENDDVYWR